MSEVKKDEVIEDAKAKEKTKAAKKAAIKKNVVKEIESDKQSEIETLEDIKTTRKRSTQIELNEMICLRSVTKGGLTYISPKTGVEVTWNDYGTEEYLEYSEILTMKSAKPRFLNEPFVVIDDEDVAQKLGYKAMYENIVDIDNLEDFYKQSIEKISDQLDKSPNGIKKLIADKARDLVVNNSLTDIRKIKLLEEKLKIELRTLID